MLRILHVIGKMDRAGAETMIMNLYRNMNREQIQFDFMVFTDQEADYDDEIRYLGGNIYHMPAFKGINYLSLGKSIDQFFSAHHYDIVHGHIGSLAPLYLKIAKKHGAFAIAHSHATNSTDFIERTVFGFLAHPVRYIADYFLACSKQAGIDRFGNRIVESDRFSILNNGIDCNAYKYSEERHKLLKKRFHLEDKTIIGHVGRFVPEKNHEFLIDVFEQIHQTNSDTILILAGRGPEEEKIREIVKIKNLENHVMFLGIRDDISDLMNLFDIFIFPSMHEGLGSVGVEAQAAGLPSFVSEGIPNEAILTNHCWILSLKDSAKEWALTIERKMMEFERCDSSEEIIKAEYDIGETANRLQKFYLSHQKQEG